tara:strand:+ start:343 stop:585 length:243 start_codon:yes stop_codon:yes gene_type:complete
MNEGFYKLEGQHNLLFGPNFVKNSDYTLLKEDRETYEYPVDGWYWQKSEEEARAFFGLPIEEADDLDLMSNVQTLDPRDF